MLMIGLKISEEEKFLINVLFNTRNKIEEETNVELIDFDILVKITSEHLMLPSLYINLKNKNLLKVVPKELSTYLKEIYEINKNRNHNLLKEAKEISHQLIKNNINHAFLKGTSYIVNEIYEDLGERMIGDIDFIVAKNDFNRAIELIKKKNYKDKILPMTSYARHNERLINNKKTFAVEIHIKLIPEKHKEKLNPEVVLKNKFFTDKKIYSLNNLHEILYNIYNYQINDYGSHDLNYSYRSFYDTYLLVKKTKKNKLKIKLNKFINNYLLISKELKINYKIFPKTKEDNFNIYRFKLKKFSRLYFIIDQFTINSIKKIERKRKHIVEFLINRKFREYTFKKTILKLKCLDSKP